MAAANHCVRPRLSPCPLLPVSLSLPAPPASRRLRRGRPPFASWRPPPSPSPAPPLPRKRVSGTHREDAEADGAVVDEGAEAKEQLERGDGEYVSSVGTNFSLPLPARLRVARAAPGGDPVFFLLAAVAVTLVCAVQTCVAFTGMVVVAIPTMLAMRRATNSFSMLADAALEELPSTMAAVRLSGMEISDLTLELSDLSHEIADGVNKSAKVAQAVEAGIGQMQNIARQQAKSMVEERANLRTIPTVGQDKESHKSSSRLRQ
ncbi:hypothetical protein SETIT_3G302200v2 [Setaria italica]|uniref:Uncharacterized protein n=2 Tax=Setaria italica TaxID=4555 RepID=A0A368QKF2_SETIT|nr:uncharacterized protein LOC101775507 isoform X1 [Setaria italica]RCV18457.1 hypothetical protein SETIT_3G302200v2 [Setaria italica]